ncbi:hypothetical protein H8959_003977, partial [Pygathrix nigripes]
VPGFTTKNASSSLSPAPPMPDAGSAPPLRCAFLLPPKARVVKGGSSRPPRAPRDPQVEARGFQAGFGDAGLGAADSQGAWVAAGAESRAQQLFRRPRLGPQPCTKRGSARDPTAPRASAKQPPPPRNPEAEPGGGGATVGPRIPAEPARGRNRPRQARRPGGWERRGRSTASRRRRLAAPLRLLVLRSQPPPPPG